MRVQVLIIDDDPAVLRLLARIVEREGHTAVPVGDGEAGLSVLAGPEQPDAVILDRMLPGIDGAEVLRRIRAERTTAELPVVLLTADARECAGLADGTLTQVLGKPFDLADLRATLADLASRSRTG